jgi:RNA polymerase sigma factor (sigma-70 family)
MLPEELLLLTANGDKTAFRQLYDMFKDRVYNTCLSYLQQPAEAEEATQDVFIEVYNSASRFESRSMVQTWIYRIAINKCLDRLRFRKRQKRFAFIASLFHSETGELIHDPAGFEHPGVLMEQKERSAKLFAAIRALPENQRTAFILKQVEGLPQKEIVEIMNMTEKAVESLLQRAKANLRKTLQDMYRENEGK